MAEFRSSYANMSQTQGAQPQSCRERQYLPYGGTLRQRGTLDGLAPGTVIEHFKIKFGGFRRLKFKGVLDEYEEY